MYCYYNVFPEAILLFTGKQHCLKIFSGDLYLQRVSIFMQNFKVGGVTVLAVQLFNKIKRKEKKMTKNLKKRVSLYFPHVMSKYIYIW